METCKSDIQLLKSLLTKQALVGNTALTALDVARSGHASSKPIGHEFSVLFAGEGIRSPGYQLASIRTGNTVSVTSSRSGHQVLSGGSKSKGDMQKPPSRYVYLSSFGSRSCFQVIQDTALCIKMGEDHDYYALPWWEQDIKPITHASEVSHQITVRTLLMGDKLRYILTPLSPSLRSRIRLTLTCGTTLVICYYVSFLPKHRPLALRCSRSLPIWKSRPL
jgi:hypothetical protein